MAQDIGEKAYLSHTAQEIDNAIDALPTKAAAADLTAEVTAREKTDAALAGQIDGGSKNRIQTNSASNTGAWVNIAVDLPAGDYVLYIGNLASTDTDASTCQLGFFDPSWTNVIANGLYPQMDRGDNVYKAVKITRTATWLRLYSSDSVAHGSGDTLTATDIMVCTEADWAISQKYVPYCPTMAELYQMILDLGGGNRSMSAAPTEQEEQR